MVYRVALICTGGLVKCNKMTGYSTKWKETDLTWPEHLVLLKMSIPGVRITVFTAMCFYDLIFIMLFQEHGCMVVEICGYSARSISLPFHLSLSLSLSLSRTAVLWVSRKTSQGQ